MLNDYDLARYNRQMMLAGWGEAGQEKIKAASVFIVGAGGLGSPASIYLAAAGVGELRICDADRLELSNLNRQILHSDSRVGELKAQSAERTLHELNPTIKITTFTDRLDENNAECLIGQATIMVDCLDNYATRYLLNDYGITHHIPLVHGAIWGLMGQATFIYPPETPCLKCIFPEAPIKAVFPVAGVTPGLIGCVQAMEVLKFITGMGTLLKNRLLIFEGEDMMFSTVNVKRLPNCPACGASLMPAVLSSSAQVYAASHN